MTLARPLAALALLLVLAGCGTGERLKKLQEASLSERCAQAMQDAFPGAEIEVKGQQTTTATAQQSLATVTITVEGRREKLPANSALRHDVAVECRFDDGILTGFRWTKGPLQ
jgi:hypothetical protein